MHAQHSAPKRLPHRSPTPAIALALVLLGALLALGGWATRQLNDLPGTAFITAETPRQPNTPAELSPVGANTRNADGPGWETLNTPQKLALYPLAERWALMSSIQKRRWLALAQNFHQLPEEEQTRLHERMSTWASLSAQQRNQARINFAATQRLKPGDKRSQWDAYQALSAEEKKRLAASAAAKPRGAATSIQPVSPKKLTRVPAATKAPINLANPPKVAPSASGAPARIAAPGGPAEKPATPTVAPQLAAPASAAASSPATSEPAEPPPTPRGNTEDIYIN